MHYQGPRNSYRVVRSQSPLAHRELTRTLGCLTAAAAPSARRGDGGGCGDSRGAGGRTKKKKNDVCSILRMHVAVYLFDIHIHIYVYIGKKYEIYYHLTLNK